MPQRYRKNPVEIEAIQLTRDNVAEVEAFIHGKAEEKRLPGPGRGLHEGVVIRTLEGDMRASWGDWVIKGVKGEFYPCKPDIFAETYHLVEPVDPAIAELAIVTAAQSAMDQLTALIGAPRLDVATLLGPTARDAALAYAREANASAATR